MFNFFVSVLCSDSCALVHYNSTNSVVIRSGGGILQLLEAIPTLEMIRFVCIPLVVFSRCLYTVWRLQLNGTSDLIDHTTYVCRDCAFSIPKTLQNLCLYNNMCLSVFMTNNIVSTVCITSGNAGHWGVSLNKECIHVQDMEQLHVCVQPQATETMTAK